MEVNEKVSKREKKGSIEKIDSFGKFWEFWRKRTVRESFGGEEENAQKSQSIDLVEQPSIQSR